MYVSVCLCVCSSDLDSRFHLVGGGSLRVVAARAHDAGAYTCRAHSRLDSADLTTHLHVIVSMHTHPSTHMFIYAPLTHIYTRTQVHIYTRNPSQILFEIKVLI